MRKAIARARPLAWIAAAAGAAVVLRLAGIFWGLPHTFNADEPHLVNLAVSFGAGSLRPYAFKYPTLWPYLLFFFYGVYFLFWSGLGLRHRLGEFVGLFAWHPAGFYLIGRLLAAFFSLLGVFMVFRSEEEREKGGRPWAALLLSFSPVIVDLAHSCKPDCLMFFLVSAGWYYALKVYREGERRAHWACGAFFGLAMSAQYTALPALLALPLAHFFGRRRAKRLYLAESLAAAVAGLLAGSPYILIDFPRFWAGMKDLAELAGLEDWDRGLVLRYVLSNLGAFAGAGSIAGLAAVAGLARLSITERRLALVLSGPIALYAAVLSRNPDGGWPRYLLGAFPALALLAGEGLRWAERPRRPILTALLAVTALFPGLFLSAQMDRRMRLPDTRAEATAWIERNVPAGSVILEDEPHASPPLAMEKEEVAELRRRTEESGSPRARLYRGMSESHPGGGYRLYRLQRSARDLRSSPRHVELSQADAPFLDLRAGLDGARAARVEYVITSDFGATPERSPELSSFFDELGREGELIKVFAPSSGERGGPVLRIYRLAKTGPRAGYSGIMRSST